MFFHLFSSSFAPIREYPDTSYPICFSLYPKNVRSVRRGRERKSREVERVPESRERYEESISRERMWERGEKEGEM
jgi:hypothetical protein